MGRKNKDIEIIVKLASQGNFDEAQRQLERLKTSQEGAAAEGAGAIGKLQGAWKAWTSLAEVSAGKIKAAFLTTLGPIGALIVIVETVIRTFAKLITFVKDYQKEQDALNKMFLDAAKAIAEANKNKEKYADATGLEELNKAIKAQEADLRAIAHSHDEIAKKVAEQKESYFGNLFVMASTTLEYKHQLGLLAQQKDAVDHQIKAKQQQIEDEKALAKATKDRLAAEESIADRVAKLTLNDTEFKERELEKQIAAYEKAGVERIQIEEFRALETARIHEEAQVKRDEVDEKLRDRLEQQTEDDVERERQKFADELAAYEKLGADKNLLDQFRAIETARIDDLENIKKKKVAKDRLDAARQALTDLSVLQNSKNKEMAAVGKAAAMADNMIQTYLGATKAYSALAGIPVIGPPLGIAAAAAAVVAGTARGAAIAGIEMEKGGVGPGTPDGTIVKFAENSRSEAVLPLEDPRAMRMVGSAIADAGGAGRGGGDTTINLYVTATMEWRMIANELAEAAANGSPEIIRLASRLKNLADANAGRAV